MRKDLRYGLGLGALLFAFVVTYLVVRNYTEKQNPEVGGKPPPVAPAPGAESPEANPAPPLAATDGAAATNRSAALPPLVPAPRGDRPPVVPAPQPPKADPFGTRRNETGNGVSANTTQDWDRLLEQGRLDPVPNGRTGTAQRVPQPPLRNSRGSGSTPPPAAPPTLGTRTGRPYRINEGDTFVTVSRAAYGNSKYFHQIERANPGVDPTRLKIGQLIILPELSAEDRATRESGPITGSDNRPINPKTEYRVDTGDSLYRISMRLYGTPNMIDAIYETNKSAIGANPERLRFGMILRLPRSPAEQGSK
jgi:nucleoid-associated protein YgaU